LGEKYTGRILNKIGAKALGNPELLKKVTQTPLVELGKDLGIEFTTGGLQSFTQEVSDKWTKGQEVQWIPTLKKALDDALLESASVGTFAAAGQGVSGTRKLTAPLKRYLATKIIAKEDASYIKKGVATPIVAAPPGNIDTPIYGNDSAVDLIDLLTILRTPSAVGFVASLPISSERDVSSLIVL